MTSIAAVQLYIQTLRKVRHSLEAIDDAAQELGRLVPHDSFSEELENYTAKFILEANNANKRIYESGTLFFNKENNKPHKLDVSISEGEQAPE
jgi:hypothetical protein